jgi:hypothetical protein
VFWYVLFEIDKGLKWLAEYFIEAGYAVIFLHRKFSLLPYSRHYSHTTNCFLDFMAEGPDSNVQGTTPLFVLKNQSIQNMHTACSLFYASINRFHIAGMQLTKGQKRQSLIIVGFCNCP